MQQRNTAAIEVPGKPSEVDSFAVCLQAALKQWGRNVPYDCVTGLAGTAFCPPLDRDARCPALWMEAGADVRMEFLAHAMGFTVERTTGTALRGTASADRSARRAQAALAKSGALLCRMPRGWNIASQTDPDGGLLLLGPTGQGSVDEVADDARVYLLRPAERSLSSYEALHAAVKFGALAASGACEAKGAAFGGQVYNAWLERLRRGAFCPQCGPQEWRCAEQTTGRARRSHLAATRFLNRAYAFLPPEQDADGLRNAADTFAAMATTLVPFTDAGMERSWHDQAQRARYANSIARVRDLHREAAWHLCQAAGKI